MNTASTARKSLNTGHVTVYLSRFLNSLNDFGNDDHGALNRNQAIDKVIWDAGMGG